MNLCCPSLCLTQKGEEYRVYVSLFHTPLPLQKKRWYAHVLDFDGMSRSVLKFDVCLEFLNGYKLLIDEVAY